MKKTLLLMGILLMALAPCMAIGQTFQPLYPGMPGMGPPPSYMNGPTGIPNRQPVAQNTYRALRNFPFNIGVPDLTPGFGVHAGFLLLQPNADNLGWAVVTNVKNPASPHPVASPFWTIQTLVPSYGPGFEMGVRYVFANSGKDFQVNWQHLRSSTSKSVIAEEGLQWVSPFSQTGPSSAQTFDDLTISQGVNKLRSARGQASFEYDVVNFDFGQYVNIGSWTRVRLFGGLSYVRLEEQLISSFFGAPPDPSALFPESVPLFIALNAITTFAGVGPRFGLDTSYEIPHGFRLTGQFAGALMIGPKQPSQYLFAATAPELAAVGISVNRESINSANFTQVASSWDGKLGIANSYASCKGSAFTIEAGYMATVYIDPFSAYETNHNVLPLQIGSLSTASMRHTLSNFTVNGPYVTGGLKW